MAKEALAETRGRRRRTRFYVMCDLRFSCDGVSVTQFERAQSADRSELGGGIVTVADQRVDLGLLVGCERNDLGRTEVIAL